MLEEQMNALVQAEMSVLVDILYHPEVLFHSSAPVHQGFSGGFMTKYEQPYLRRYNSISSFFFTLLYFYCKRTLFIAVFRRL